MEKRVVVCTSEGKGEARGAAKRSEFLRCVCKRALAEVVLGPLLNSKMSQLNKGILSDEISELLVPSFIEGGRVSLSVCRGGRCSSCGSFFAHGVLTRRHPVSKEGRMLVDPYSKGIAIYPVRESKLFLVGRARCAIHDLLGSRGLTGHCRNKATCVVHLAMSSCRECYCITSNIGSTRQGVEKMFRAMGPITGSCTPVCGVGAERCYLMRARRLKAILRVRINTLVIKQVGGRGGGMSIMRQKRRGKVFRFNKSAIILLARPKGIRASRSLIEGDTANTRALVGVNRGVNRGC